MRRFLLASALILSCNLVSYSQAKCELTIDKSPEIRGFRLGMLRSSIPFIPGLTGISPDEYGYRVDIVSGRLAKEANPERFNGVSGITLKYLDDKLYDIHIAYDDSVRWNDVVAFTDKLSAALALPGLWKDDGITREMYCGGFTISARVIYGKAEVRLTDSGAEEKIASRKAEAEKSRQQTFKP